MTKIAFISDLHTRQKTWQSVMESNGQWDRLQKADIICFCGDMSSRGSFSEIELFLQWFDTELPDVPKIFIAGNHDFAMEDADKEDIQEMLVKYPKLTYLNDSGCEFNGINFWGSPVSPFFRDWAFNRVRDEDGPNNIKAHWDMIPGWVDVLITHGPPKGILDKVARPIPGEDPHVGCDYLLDSIQRVEPSIAAFGHIHEGYGIENIQHVTYVNASCLNERYMCVNPPIFVELNNEGQS